jgi:GNAT superfamily N-acetyltransferase
MFDVPLRARSEEVFQIDLPPVSEPWQIGLIVGPSASGKSTLAREFLGDRLWTPNHWPVDRAIVDCLRDIPTKSIIRLFTAVGLSSPPAWLRPYHVLSGGEKFRCELARALASASGADPGQSLPILGFDEFTSMVDRTVARVASAAVSKAIRQGLVSCRFVAVTCHYDVARWLSPDWIADLGAGRLSRRRLRRPPIKLRLFRTRHAVWKLFARHHYLSGSLSRTARCFVALWNGRPVAFCATIPAIRRRGYWRITRLVTLPDYQGIGIGMKLAEAVAGLHVHDHLRIGITASHPAVIAHCRSSPAWRFVRLKKSGEIKTGPRDYCGSPGRIVVSFEFKGNANARSNLQKAKR